MNLKTINVVMFLTGVVLVYSGIKGYKPQTVLSWALGGPKPSGWGANPADNWNQSNNYNGQLGGGPGNPKTGGNGVAPGDHPGDSPWSYSTNGTSAVYTGPVTNPVAGGNASV